MSWKACGLKLSYKQFELFHGIFLDENKGNFSKEKPVSRPRFEWSTSRLQAIMLSQLARLGGTMPYIYNVDSYKILMYLFKQSENISLRILFNCWPLRVITCKHNVLQIFLKYTFRRKMLKILWHDGWIPEWWSQKRRPMLRKGSVNTFLRHKGSVDYWECCNYL
jgi:hypothetical protein